MSRKIIGYKKKELEQYYPRYVSAYYLKERFIGDKMDPDDIDIDVMDSSWTNANGVLIGTHKGPKGKHGHMHVRGKGGGYLLLLTGGNAGHAFNVVGEYFPGNQVVQFMINESDKMIDIDSLSFRRPTIAIKAPKRWCTPRKLEQFWKDLFDSRKDNRELREYRNDVNFPRLVEIVEKTKQKYGIDYTQAYDVTNARDYAKNDPNLNLNPYASVDEINQAVRNYEHIFSVVGSGEYSENLVEERMASIGWFKGRYYNKPASLLLVTVNGNPVSLDRKGETDADKLPMDRESKAIKRIRKIADSGVSFFSVPSRAVEHVVKGLVDAVVQHEEKTRPGAFDLRTELTSTVTFAPLYLAKPCKEGLAIPAYQFPSRFSNRKVPGDYIIHRGDRICIVHTGTARGKNEKVVIY